MHSGFAALRQECPMNMRRRAVKEISFLTKQDLNHVYELWSLVKKHPDRFEGPYLAGQFSFADAFFLPLQAVSLAIN